MTMQEELLQVAGRINQVLEEDPFPSTIEPVSLRQAVKAYPCRGGKRLRPALLTWSCQLHGGDPKQAVFAAAAVEVYHNWTLVHDDIIDNDLYRRGEPTTHKSLTDFALNEFETSPDVAVRHGRDFAILAGDVQQGWAVNLLLRSTEIGVSPELVLAMSRRLQETVNRELISGEALDVEFALRPRDQISADEVRHMLYLKTGSLLRFCAECGAAIALNEPDFTDEKVSRIGDFAAAAAVAFQLRDDWLGVFGDPVKVGKPLFSDLSESKPTLLLMTALGQLGEDDREILLGLTGKESYTADEQTEIRRLMRDSGAEDTILAEADELATEAHTILDDYPDSPVRQLLSQLVDHLVKRES